MLKSLHPKVALFLCLIFFIIAAPLNAQTTVLDQNFNNSSTANFTTSGSIPGSIWKVTRSGANFGAKIDQGLLTLTNTASSAANYSGWVLVSTPTSNFGSSYKNTLDQNAGIVSWTFNMKQSRSNPNGFKNGQYGVAYVLAGSATTSKSTGIGYALQFGDTNPNSKNPRNIRLVRYASGLETFYTILSSSTAGLTNIGTGNVSIRVEYNPQTDLWALYARRDANGPFTDPKSGTLIQQEVGSHINSITGQLLEMTGAFWNAGTDVPETADFDNLSVSVAVPEITSLTPISVVAGSPALKLTVNGKNFSAGSKILWNGIALTTTVVSAAQLTANVPVTEIAVSGSANVSVQTGTMISNSLPFTILPSGSPLLTVSAAALNLPQTITGTASGSQSYTLRGDNLPVNAGTTVTAPANFELSLNGNTWSNVLNIPNTQGGFDKQPLSIQARLKASAGPGLYSGTITHTATGSPTKSVTISGKAIATQPTILAKNLAFTNITSTSFTINWTNGNGGQRLLLLKKTSAITVKPLDGSTYNASYFYKIGSNLGDETYAIYKGEGTFITVENLDPASTYHASIFEFNGATSLENYMESGFTGYATTKISPQGLQINAVNASTKIDFDKTVDGVNAFQFKGRGIASNALAGQLDSDSWAFTGFSSGDLTFGVNSPENGTYSRGISTGNVQESGIYGFNLGTAPTENYALGIQPGGTDFNPGTITLKMQNKTNAVMTSVNIGYTVYVRNDQASSTKIGFSYSADGSTFTEKSDLDVVSKPDADLNPDWKAYYRVVTIPTGSIANDANYYIRWSGSLASGAGQQDEFAIDDIEVIANPSSTFASFEGVAEDFVLAGNANLSGDLQVQNKLVFNGGKVFINNKTLTIASTVTNTITGGLSGGLTSKIIIKGNRNPFLSFDQTSDATRTLASLNLVGSSVNTVSVTNNLIVNDALELDNLQTLDLRTNVLSGSLTEIKNNGEIQTQNTSDTPFPAEKDWTGTGILHLNSATVAQKLVAGTYNNLTLRSTGGTVANANITVNGILDLPAANESSTTGSLHMSGISELTMGNDGTNIGVGEVTGIIKRIGFVTNKLYTFGHPNSSITFPPGGTLPTSMSIKLTIGAAPDWRTESVRRSVDIIQSGASATKAIIRQNYLDSEVPIGKSETKLVFWINRAILPIPTFEQGRSSNNITNNWVELINADVGLFFSNTFGKVFITLDETAGIGTTTWKGLLGTSWTTAENWTNGKPSETTQAIIPDATTTDFDPELNNGETIGSLLIEAGGIVNSTDTDVLILTSGGGAWQNFGTFNPGTASTITFNNLDATIAGSTTFNSINIPVGGGIRPAEGNYMSISGTLTNSGTMFTTLIPNTIEFLGNNKTIPNVNGLDFGGYHNLIISGSNPSFAPSITTLNIRGDLTVNQTINFAGKTVNMTGLQKQTIGGPAAINFDNLIINKEAEAVSLTQNVKVGGTLTLQSGNVIIGAKNLTLGQSAVAGTPGVNSMIVADGTGKVVRPFATIGEYFFPIGEMTSNPAYSPIKIKVTEGSFSGDASVSVSVEDRIHPNNKSLQNYISRFWNVTQVGISNAKANITGTYVEAENLFPQASMAAGQLDGTFDIANNNTWIKVGSLSGTTLLAENVSLTSGKNSVFTGIKGGNFTVEVYGYGGFCQGSPASLEAVTDGGDAPFTYSWSNALLNEKIDVPTAVVGTINYTLTVTDANGFVATDNNSPVEVFAPSFGGTVTITNPASCATTLELKDNIGEVLYWQRSTDSSFSPETTMNIGNTTSILTNREIGIIDTPIYFRAVVQNGPCGQVYSDPVTIATNSTTWQGPTLGWTNLAPTTSNTAIFAANYSELATPLTACNIRVNEDVTLRINADSPLTVQNDIVNFGDIIVESNGNLVQVSDSGEYRTNPVLSSMPTFTVKTTANIKRLDYVFWSSPVQNQQLKGFSKGTLNNRFLTYNEQADSFDIVADVNANFNPAKGYAIRASNYQSNDLTDWKSQFVGTPNNGLQKFPLSKLGNGFNLVGNPYPSNINFNELVSGTPGNSALVHSLAYFWTNTNPNGPMQGSEYPKGELINNYAIYNGIGGVPATRPAENATDANLNSPTPDGIIRVGQGFIVKAIKAGDLEFRNNSKVKTPGNFFDRTEQTDRFWLNLTTPLRVQTSTLIGYKASATNGFELDYDAPLMVLGADAFYSVLDDLKLAIQGKAPFTNNDIISLGTSHYQAGNYTISLGDTEGVFANGQNIYLKDHQTNTVTNLSNGDYTFEATAGITEGRFEIIYKTDNVLGTDNLKKDDLIVYREGTDFIVKSAKKKISDLEVYDTSGRLMTKQNPNQTEIRIDGRAMINGVYILKINQNGKITTRKIIR